MRILHLCSKIPYPARDGGCLAMLNLADMMHNSGTEVKLLAMETHKHPLRKEGFPATFVQKFKPESVYVNTAPTLLNALTNLLFTSNSYHLVRFQNQQFETKLIALLNSYKPNIVVLDSLFTSGYIQTIKTNSKAKIIYRAHNVEYVIWKEIAAKTKSFFKKNYLRIQSERLKNEELHVIEQCDGILAITSKDAEFFTMHFAHKKVMTLPFTVDVSAYMHANNYHQKALFFIGAMDWYPNLEGVNWFIDKVWNAILMKHPAAKFYIAGKAMPDALMQLEEKNIFNMGEVADAKAFMAKAPVMIAPIFSGGGLKIKMVEAMAMGKIVICNPQAASGIPVTDKKNALLANSSTEFISLICNCFDNLSQHSVIGEEARKLIDQHFSTQTKGKELELFLISIL